MPQTALPRSPMSTLVPFARNAESAGLDSVWVQEDILSDRGTLEPLVVLAAVAAATERVRLGVATLLVAHYNPVHLAKSLATLDILADGRLTIGVSLGTGSARDAAFGIPAGRRVTHFNDALRIMRELWNGEPVHDSGAGVHLCGEAMTPIPLQRPHPPLWFGGQSRAALERAARFGDGFVAGGVTTATEFAAQVQAVRHLRETEGQAGPYAFAKRIFLAIDRDPARARRRLTDWLSWFYADEELADRIAVAGDVNECLDGIRAVIAAGATHVILNFVFDHEKALEIVASDVLPEL